MTDANSKRLMTEIMALHSSGFRQAEYWDCGPSSLWMVAEALGITRKVSDWYADSLKRWFNCDDFRTRGMALHEAQAISEIVFGPTAEIKLRRAFPESKEQFLNDLKEATGNSNLAIVLNFSQCLALGEPIEGQGNPHYSPVVDIDLSGKRLLIADVDGEVPDPYWISFEKSFESMALINPAFKVPRGWLSIRKRNSI